MVTMLQLIYIGKEYDIDILNIYFEIEDVDCWNQ